MGDSPALRDAFWARQNAHAIGSDDPTLEVRDANGGLLAFNDDWVSNCNEILSTGLAPSNNAEAAVRLSLPRGSYTAIVRAKSSSGRVALLEFYDLRR